MAERDRWGAGRAPRLAFYVLLGAGAVLTPLAVAALDPPLLANSYGRRTVAFELMGFTVALALLVPALLEARARRGQPARDWLPRLLPLLLGLFYATWLAEHSRKPFDYDCYEYAARAILLGENPYVTGLNYLYPPLTAQVLAAVHGALGVLGFGLEGEARWDAVFYLYQCAQLGLILLLYGLALALARELGLELHFAGPLVALLLLVDNPLLRTLRHGQVNLWVLDLSLLAILLARRAPAVAGTALALAVHIKLYPLVLLLPLAADRCGRALSWSAAAFAGIVVLQTDLLRDWTPWIQFAEFYRSVYPGEVAFRNNSFHSLAHNTLRLVFGLSRSDFREELRLVTSAFSLVMAGWLLLRIARRARRRDRDAAWRLRAGADALAFSLLISQSVWEHHYLLALPLVIHAAAGPGRERPVAVAVAAFLAIGLPTVDLFPLSYHRAAGLVWLLSMTAPGRPKPPS
jgi:hypothetical protein